MTTALIAFSGGLDTSFLVPYCREAYGISRIITCTVNTGGFSKAEAAAIEERSRLLGADQHIYRSAARKYYDSVIKYLIYGNVSRDGYPLCVGSERSVIAEECMKACREVDASIFIHGSTGAGNDQYRFDVAAHVLTQGTIMSRAPIREFGITRDFAATYLEERGVPVPVKTSSYSYNPGLWGVSIGGKETLRADGLLPQEAWYSSADSSRTRETITISFSQGKLTRLTVGSETLVDPVDIIQKVAQVGSAFGIGRHYHVGTSLPGKKGRLAYESPAADIIYEAHRTLEKVVLSQAQIMGKRTIADAFGALIHEARVFDPYVDDLRAFLESTQRRVTGTCSITLVPNAIESVTVSSPFDLLAVKGSTYGEINSVYSGADAAGSALLHGYEQKLYHSIQSPALKEEVKNAA